MQSLEDSQKGKKRPLKEGGEFVCFRQYSNSLPNAPSGPFFKTRPMQASFDKYANYEVSTLEKSFVWQPHFGPEVGIKLDLVDQDEILKLQQHSGQMDPGDQKFIQGVDRNKKKTRGIDIVGEKPWWLRNTTYLENNLFKVTTRDNSAVTRKIPVQQNFIDPLSVDAIEASFTDVVSTVSAQLSGKESGGKTVEWCMEFAPGPFIGANIFSLIRFDEDPQKLVDAISVSDGKKRKISRAVVSNSRKSSTVESRNAIHCSLGAPDEQAFSSATDSSVCYDWISDFKVDVKTGEVDDYLIVLPGNAAEGNDGSAIVGGSVEFFPLHSRLELRKLADQDIAPHDSYVSRRPNGTV